jgi:hypothetical protein
MDEKGIVPYQVSWEGPKERHEKALQEFYEKFPRAEPSVMVTRENVEEFLLV